MNFAGEVGDTDGGNQVLAQPSAVGYESHLVAVERPSLLDNLVDESFNVGLSNILEAEVPVLILSGNIVLAPSGVGV